MSRWNVLRVIQENVMPHPRLLGGLLIVIISIAPTVIAENDNQDEHEDESRLVMDASQRRAAGIQVSSVDRHSLEIRLSAPGEVIPNAYDSAIISPRIQAQIVARHVQLGDQVEAGQPLVTLSSVAMAEAQGGLLVTEREWQRVKSLGKEVLSDRRYSEAQVARQQAMARVLAYGMSADEADSLLRQNDASRATGAFDLLAPQDGTVIRDDFIVGELIEPGHVLFELTDESSLWIEARLAARDAPQISEAMPARISVDGVRWINGEIVQIAHSLDAQTRTRTIRVEIDNQDDLLHPGEFVQVEFLLGGDNRVLAVPASSIVTLQGSPTVFRMIAENELRAILVETGKTSGVWVEIRAGLSEGDEIAIEGAFALKAELLKRQRGD